MQPGFFKAHLFTQSANYILLFRSNKDHKVSHAAIDVVYMLLSVNVQIHTEKV